MKNSKVIMTTMCIVWDRDQDKIIMINKQKGDWRGYTPPGGHVDFPESITGCTIREVKEETGLIVKDLSFKGLVHFVNEDTGERYLVFNYITDKFNGKLNNGTDEGKPEWVKLSDIYKYKLAPGVDERLDLFFKEHSTEMHILWDESGKKDVKKILV